MVGMTRQGLPPSTNAIRELAADLGGGKILVRRPCPQN